ncbi:MAG TPA: hypothetical protein VGH53_02545 [Streptosporangiaceae bacterium]|jgi:hypothetical protein
MADVWELILAVLLAVLGLCGFARFLLAARLWPALASFAVALAAAVPAGFWLSAHFG